jgi:hypothetical protein
MSTRAELEAGLNRTFQSWDGYKQTAGSENLPILNPTVPGTTDKDRLECNIKHLLDKADKFPDVWYKRLCRLCGLPTSDERTIELGERSTDAAVRAVSVAEEGNRIARTANRLSRWALLIAVASGVIAALAWVLPRGPR